MMLSLFQILVTVWFHGHQMTEYLPETYPQTNDLEACQKQAKKIYDHRKTKIGKAPTRIFVECVPAVTEGI